MEPVRRGMGERYDVGSGMGWREEQRGERAQEGRLEYIPATRVSFMSVEWLVTSWRTEQCGDG